MELGKGYAFVARQQHIHTEKQDYYIDLVFYNYILKCFVLIDFAISFSEKAIEIVPTYYVSGNHEARIDEYEDLPERYIDTIIPWMKGLLL